jgi:diaminohydroxyphosphoribosylaminopyrimidine deaminase / 5-amino-6-(5-phosphoribosylamino)uracil reductase
LKSSSNSLATADAGLALADISEMRAAVALAKRGLGRVWPNPAVGCVLVRDGHVVGRGWTQPGGRPHAETEALKRARDLARRATAYVTLEPCDHEGVTGPCSDALLGAAIGRAVVAMEDPDPRVSGRGIARLREAGIEVAVGICREEATEINLGFLLRVTQQRPMITLKLATSLDGRIATASGDSKWITGEQARAEAHSLRASHDAVLVGSGTALADDPALTCRLPGMKDRSPLRVIADSRLRLPLSAEVVRTADKVATWVVTGPERDAGRRQDLVAAGVRVIEVASDQDGRPDTRAMAAALAERGLTRVLLEGGGELATAFLRAGLIDRVAWFHAPRVVGAEGIPAVGGLRISAVADAPAFLFRKVSAAGGDVLAQYVKQTET